MMNSIDLLSIDPVSIGMTPEGIVLLCDEQLAYAKTLVEEIRALDGTPDEALTWEATLAKVDLITHAVSNAICFPQLMSVAHPDAAVRDAAKTCEPKVDAFVTPLYMDAQLARVFRRYADKKEVLSGPKARLLEFTLRDYRRNGLDLDAPGKARLRELNEEMTKLGQDFETNLASSLSMNIRADQLAGLPPAYVANHPVDEQGMVKISTDYPDIVPFTQYAKDRDVARELNTLSQNRAAEKNLPILDRLLALRYEKARLLGYPTWAEYVLETRMAKHAETVRQFIDDLHRDLRPKAQQEADVFRAAYIKHGGKLTDTLWTSDRPYLNDLASKDAFAFDSQKLSEYFEVTQVLQGILDIASSLYNLTFSRVTDPAWHEEVVAMDVMDQDKKPFGRLYIDLYPREGKYKHAAVFTIRHTLQLPDRTRLLPMAALVCNFPKPGGAGPALLSHEEVVTFFHEFGHAIHDLVSTSELSTFSGTSVARDFVEAPSQMFEEWAWSRETLDRFARHHVTGENLPEDLFAAMIKAKMFGEAIHTERQLFLADLDLTYHTHTPGFNTTDILEELQKKYAVFTPVPNTYFQSSFGHLVGYDAGYYGYQWALSIARDIFTRFETEGLMNANTAKEYRDHILAPGGSEDEAQLVKHFLGRPTNSDAYKKFLGI